MLTELGRADDYIERSLDGRLRWNPLSATWLDAYSLAYTVALNAPQDQNQLAKKLDGNRTGSYPGRHTKHPSRSHRATVMSRFGLS